MVPLCPGTPVPSRLTRSRLKECRGHRAPQRRDGTPEARPPIGGSLGQTLVVVVVPVLVVVIVVVVVTLIVVVVVVI